VRPNAFAMELLGRSVGVLVEEGRHFRFYTSDSALRRLERRIFNSVAHAERTIRAVMHCGASTGRGRPS